MPRTKRKRKKRTTVRQSQEEMLSGVEWMVREGGVEEASTVLEEAIRETEQAIAKMRELVLLADETLGRLMQLRPVLESRRAGSPRRH